jgi:SAM-dependent methyltransferase
VAPPKYVSDFDTLAGEYDRFRSSYSDALFDAIVEYAGPMRGRRALDLACGTGLSTRGLAARGVAVTGIDVAPNMLDVARRSGYRGATFFTARAESTPFADGSFGLVTCGQAFHWFDARSTLAEIERVLVPGGAHVQYWKDSLPTDPMTKTAEDLQRDWSGRDPAVLDKELWGNLRDVWHASRLVDRRKVIIDVSLPFTVETFVGYHRSRETLRLELGERREEYLGALEEKIRSMAPAGGRFEVQAKEYLFLARRSGGA